MIFKNLSKEIDSYNKIITNISNAGKNVNEVAKITKGLSETEATLLMRESGLNEVMITKVNAINGVTTATMANIGATEAQEKSEEDQLLDQWLSIGADEAEVVSTTAVTTAQTANIGIVDIMKMKYQQLAVSIGLTTTQLGVLLGVIGGVAVAGVAIYAIGDALIETKKEAKETLDEVTEAFEQTKSEVQSLQSELKTTSKKIDELLAKENLTLVESEELERLKKTNDELERELRIKEALQEQQGKEANDEAIDYFNVKVTDETKVLSYDSFTGSAIYDTSDQIVAVENRIKSLQALEKSLEDLEDKQAKYQLENEGEENQYLSNLINEKQNEIDKARKFIDESIVDFQEQDDYLIKGLDDGILNRLDAIYQLYDEAVNGVAQSHENQIKGILAKSGFQDEAESLTKLAKNGNLTINSLKDVNGEFASLVNYLDSAGISAEELYQYIMALANPDAINFKNVKGQFLNDVGALNPVNNKEDAEARRQIMSQLEEAGVLSDEGMEAYLNIRGKYDTTSWNVEDWIYNIQQYLKGEPIVVSITFEQSLETAELTGIKDDLAGLAQAGKLDTDTLQSYERFDEILKALGVTGELTDEELQAMVDTINSIAVNNSVDYLHTYGTELEKLKDAYLNYASGTRITAEQLSALQDAFGDLDSYQEFEQVILTGNGDIQQAFNKVATELASTTNVLYGLTEANAEYYESELKAQGVVNAHEVVEAALAGQQKLRLQAIEELNAANNSLNDGTQDLIISEEALEDATIAEIAALVAQANATGVATQSLAIYALQKAIANQIDLTNGDDINSLLTLAKAAGVGVKALDQLSIAYGQYQMTIKAYGTNSSQANVAYQALQAAYSSIQSEIANFSPVDYSVIFDDDDAASAGGKAGDAYVEAYEKELEELGKLRDRGEIDEAEYLARMKALYERYFSGISKYQDKYFEEQHKYLSGMKSLYDSALSGISKLMSNKIDGYQEAKEVAIESLEAEKEAADEAYQAQIDAIEDVIEEKEKIIEGIEDEIDAIEDIIDGYNEQIDAINDQIDAMREANEERQRAIDLQKAQYELERMQNQRTQLIYTDTKGFNYVQDTSGIRDAKDAVDDAQLEINIAEKEKEISAIEDLIDAQEKIIKQKEKQIDLVQKEIDALNDQKENIQEMQEASNEYYEKLIKQQERYYDSLIKSAEKQKSDWEGIGQIKEIAEAYSAVEQVFGELGYSVEDVLNGNTSAFEDFKSKYISIMSDMGQNTAFQDGLEYASGVMKENFGSIVNDSQGVKDALTDIGNTSTGLQPVANAMETIGTSASTASTDMSAVSSSMQTLNNNTNGLEEKLSGISDALTTIPTSTKFDAIANAFRLLGDAITGVATALGVGEEGTVGGLVDALQTISSLSLDGISSGEGNAQGGTSGTGGGIISQFEKLKGAVDAVTSAIDGSGGSGSSDGGDPSGSSSPSMGDGASGGSLTGALDSLKDKASSVIGSSSGDDEGSSDGKESSGNGSDTVIGAFEGLKTAVSDVSDTIGTGEEEEETDDSTLTGAITGLGKKTTEVIGSPSETETVTGRFQQMSDVLDDAKTHLNEMASTLETLSGQSPWNVEIQVEITGSTGAFTGTAFSDLVPKGQKIKSIVNLPPNAGMKGATYTAQYGNAHYEGTAKVTGDWGVHNGGKTLVGELGQEIVVRNGRFFTVGDNGAEFVNLLPGDIVFNHLQTRELLSRGNIIQGSPTNARGQALANGTLPNGLTPLSIADTEKYKMLTMMDEMLDDVQLGVKHLDMIDRNIETIKNVTTNNRVNSQVTFGNINVTCPGITSDEVASQIGTALQKEFSGLSLKAYQQAMKR